MSHRDLLALLTVGTAAAFIVAFGHIVTADGLDWLDAGMILLHAVLTLWLLRGGVAPPAGEVRSAGWCGAGPAAPAAA